MTEKIILLDKEWDKKEYLELTEDQAKLLFWLYSNDWLSDTVDYQKLSEMPDWKKI